MLRRLGLGFFFTLLVSTSLRADCVLSTADRAFIDSAVASWQTTSRDALQLAPAPLPTLIFFDEHCVYRDGAGSAHDGNIKLPNDERVPVRLMTFASAGTDGKPFLVMALPAVWRADKRHAAKTPKELDRMMRAVFVHEMTHTRQTKALGKRIDAIIAANHLPEDVDDDVVQKKFGDRPGFRAAYEKELALFDAGKIAEGLAAMRARRAMLTGADHAYAELEDVFLEMEGVANWAAYRTEAREMSDAEAANVVRGGRKWWTQEEGLSIFLALDKRMPGWQKLVFRDDSPSLESLLAAAAATKP